jgi:hypothetical protein
MEVHAHTRTGTPTHQSLVQIKKELHPSICFVGW